MINQNLIKILFYGTFKIVAAPPVWEYTNHGLALFDVYTEQNPVLQF